MEINVLGPDIPRFYTALAECAACGLYYFVLPRRLKEIGWFLLATVLFLGVDAGWLILTDEVPIILWIPCMLVAAGLMYIYLRMLLQGTAGDILYILLKAVLIAELMASLEWQVEYYLSLYLPIPIWIRWGLVIVTYLLVAFIIYRLEKGMYSGYAHPEVGRRELTAAFLIAVASFAASNLSFVAPNTPFSTSQIREIFLIRTMVDLAGVTFFYAYQSRFFELSAERELESINTMLKAQYEHYRDYQETINLINMKYHDLKHQLVGLRSEHDPEKREQWIDSMMEELENYKPETQTGNQVLDSIIDQKMPLIRRNHITFTRVIDGKILDFLHVTDICTIFGNALDNAIEALILVEDQEKRLIHMTVSARKQFVYIEISNYCEEPVRIVNGYPQTTKKDVRNHGFGVKSIVYTAEKYGGSVNFGMNKDMFEMKILIPMP